LVSTIGWLVAVQPAKATAAIPSVAATAKKRFIVYPFPRHTLRTLSSPRCLFQFKGWSPSHFAAAQQPRQTAPRR
jgi:hypothetical protein